MNAKEREIITIAMKQPFASTPQEASPANANPATLEMGLPALILMNAAICWMIVPKQLLVQTPSGTFFALALQVTLALETNATVSHFFLPFFLLLVK